MKVYKTLSASVEVRKTVAFCQVIRQNDRKVKVVTEIRILHGNRCLGVATLGGCWTPDEALGQFRKTPTRWNVKNVPPALESIIDINLGPVKVAHCAVNGIIHSSASALNLFQSKPHLFEEAHEGWLAAVALGLVA